MEGPFIKENAVYSGFVPIRCNNNTIKVYVLFRYTSAATNLIKLDFFLVGLPSNWQNKYFSFLQ